MITVTRKFAFCTGHRLKDHEGGCRNPHGHNYVALVSFTGDGDNMGRIIDFGELKRLVGGWIDEHWDHGIIYARDDTAMASAMAAFQSIEAERGFTPPRVYVMDEAPTAEAMADHLLRQVCPKVLPAGVRATRVQLWETENCHATAEATLC